MLVAGVPISSADGTSYCLDGLLIYLCATVIQRDPAAYGPTANEFIPERWLGESGVGLGGGTGTGTDGEAGVGEGEKRGEVPAGAWRPFERGPRSCIGQELANIEGKVILACVARRYEFVKVGLGAFKRGERGERVVEGGKCVAETELYSSRQVTAKPVDGMVSRVVMRESARGGELRT